MQIENLEQATEALKKLKTFRDAQKKHENLAKTNKAEAEAIELSLERYSNKEGFIELQVTPAGSFGFLPSAPGVVFTRALTVEKIIEALKDANLTQFIRIKNELDKVPIGNAFKRGDEVCKQLKDIGISYEPGLTFKCEI